MTVTSMPRPTLPAQRVPDAAEEVVLGVDTQKDVHVAAVITSLGASLAHQEFPATRSSRPPPLDIANFWLGHARSASYTGPALNAPDPTEPR
ncbi:hypothetical protein [Streptomyces mirabilis]|uniref:hypothetical protein n=1 Tax=Streptomyces mirabilis TaxID=68239 RepID=UPI0036DF2E41